jgi:hypothetical protein
MNYIYDSWLADLRDADASFLPNDIFFPAHREVLRRVLEGTSDSGRALADKAQVILLSPAKYPADIAGYLVRDRNYLHWIHVRRGKQWRLHGLAKQLLVGTHSEKLPLVWRTKLGHERLQNPLRSRQARHAWWAETPSPA